MLVRTQPDIGIFSKAGHSPDPITAALVMLSIVPQMMSFSIMGPCLSKARITLKAHAFDITLLLCNKSSDSFDPSNGTRQGRIKLGPSAL